MENNSENPALENASLRARITQLEAEAANKDKIISSLTKENAELKESITKDPTTGLDNQRGFDEKIKAELARSRRDNTPLSAAFIDLDGFKSVNDNLGHEGGNELLKLVSATLNEHVRGTDTVARPHGDEFLILFPDTDIEESLLAVARLRILVKEAIDRYKHEKGIQFRLGFSTGIAEVGADDIDTESLKNKADALMYKAKAIDKAKRNEGNENEALYLVAVQGTDTDVVLSSSSFDQIQHSHLPLPPRELNKESLLNWFRQVIKKPLSLHLEPDQDPMEATIQQYLVVAEFILDGQNGEAQCRKFLTHIRRDLKISNRELLNNLAKIQD